MSTKNKNNDNTSGSDNENELIPHEVKVKLEELAALCEKHGVTLTCVYTKDSSEHSTSVGVQMSSISTVLKQAQGVPELALLYSAIYLLQHADRPGRELFQKMDSRSVALALALETAKITSTILQEGPLLTNAEYMEMHHKDRPDYEAANDAIQRHVDDLAKKMGLDT